MGVTGWHGMSTLRHRKRWWTAYCGVTPRRCWTGTRNPGRTAVAGGAACRGPARRDGSASTRRRSPACRSPIRGASGTGSGRPGSGRPSAGAFCDQASTRGAVAGHPPAPARPATHPLEPEPVGTPPPTGAPPARRRPPGSGGYGGGARPLVSPRIPGGRAPSPHARTRRPWDRPRRTGRASHTVRMRQPPGFRAVTARRRLDYDRRPGGRVTAWYSPRRRNADQCGKVREKRRLADSHLTSPKAVQPWTTSSPVWPHGSQTGRSAATDLNPGEPRHYRLR